MDLILGYFVNMKKKLIIFGLFAAIVLYGILVVYRRYIYLGTVNDTTMKFLEMKPTVIKLSPWMRDSNDFTIVNIIEQVYMTTEGIWGIPVHATSTYVFLFVIVP